VQHEAMRRRSGIVENAECLTIPGLQRTTPLRFVVHCAREKNLKRSGNYFRREIG